MMKLRILVPLSYLLLFTSCSSNPKNSQLGAPAQFRDVASEVGLRFVHTNGAEGQFWMPEIVGSGLAVFDFDRDGDMDVFVVQGDIVGAAPRGSGHRLFRNELIPSGSLRFTDVSADSGLAIPGVGMGAAVGDFDNDGLPDLYVTAYGPNHLFRNLGNGRFTDVTAVAGVAVNRWSTSAAFLDYDRDGWMDLYVTNYLDFSPDLRKDCRSPHDQRDYCGPQVYHGLPDRLFRNLGNGRFADQSNASRITSGPGPGLGVSPFDANEDGWLDLYVANDGKPNHLWINQRDGTFREAALELGAAMAESGVARAGMGVAIADIDENGKPDVLVTNLTNEGATLYGNEGNKGFFDVSARHAVNAPTRSRTGFGVGYFDSLNRGKLDIFIANGAVKVEPGAVSGPDPYRQPNQLLRLENGRYVDVSASSGPGLAHEEVSRSAAFSDMDNDGDIDILVTNNGGPLRLLRNETGNQHGHWLLVQLDGGPQNRLGAAARLTLQGPNGLKLHRQSEWAYGYLTANDPRVHFGLGEQSGPFTLIVTWPDGLRESFAVPVVDRILSIRRGSGSQA